MNFRDGKDGLNEVEKASGMYNHNVEKSKLRVQLNPALYLHSLMFSSFSEQRVVFIHRDIITLDMLCLTIERN